MIVRGWLIVGGGSAASGLPIEQLVYPSPCLELPRAVDLEPGRWTIWLPDATTAAVTVVCVDVPIVP